MRLATRCYLAILAVFALTCVAFARNQAGPALTNDDIVKMV